MTSQRLASKLGLWIEVIVTVIGLCCMTGISRGQCERWVQTGGGPHGGEVWWLAIDPVMPSKVYAGTPGGVYRSTDRGDHWVVANTGLPEPASLRFYQVAIDPLTPTTLYAGPAEKGVYRSTDGGDHWTAVNTGFTSRTVDSLVIDPVTPTTLYAGMYDGTVYRSTDRGDHWTAVNTELPLASVNRLAIDPINPATLYAAMYENGVYRSTDRGDHWAAVNTGFTNLGVFNLAIDPLNSANLYAAMYNGVYRSTDRGDHWAAVNTGFTNLGVYTLAIDPLSPATLYAAAYENGVYRSTDRGTSWSRINTGLTTLNVLSLAIDPLTPGTLYAATYHGAFRSTDRGDHWTGVNTGLTNLDVNSLTIDPVTPATLYVRAGAGFFRSTDRGSNWTMLNPGVGVGSLAIDPATPSTLYAGTWNGVIRSTDRGDHWTAISSGLPNQTIYSLAINPVTPATLYAAAYGGGVFRSFDRGDHWTAVNTGLANPYVRVLAIDPATPSTLYAAGSGVFRSTDGGDHWAAVNNGLTATVSSLAIDPATPATLYAGTPDDGVYRSTDRGDHWTAVNTGLPETGVHRLAIDPLNPATLYGAMYENGVYRSTDRGDHWTALRAGLKTLRVYALAIDPATPTILYAGGNSGGVHRLEWDCALHFSQLGNGLGLTSDIVLTNPSPYAAVSGAIGTTGDDGLLLPVGLDGGADFSILPLGACTRSTDGLGQVVVGSAVVGADSVLGGVVRFSIPGIGIAGVGASEPTSAFITPVRRTSAINTGVALSNPQIRAVSLQLTLRNPQGQEVAGGRRTIDNFPARGHLAQFIHELFPQAQTDVFEGTLVGIATGGQIAATALELGSQPGQFTTLPVTPLAIIGGAAELSFAQFGNGQGFTSDTVLVNSRADGSVSGTLSFLDDQGQPMPVSLSGSGVQSSRAFSIPPLGVLTLSTDGSGSLSVGSASVTADAPLGGVVRFQIPGIGIAGVGESRRVSRLLIPVRRTAGGIRTGIAFQNPGDVPVSVLLTLRDTSGAAVATRTIDNFPARGHVAQFLEELFTGLSGEFQGTVSVEVTGGTIAATAIELGSQPGQFTTLPVTPMQ